jgi:hypothetical protein
MSEANDSDCLDYVVERVIVSNVFRPTCACTQSTPRAGGGPRSIDDCRSAACPAGSRADFSQRDADTSRISMLSGRIQEWIDQSFKPRPRKLLAFVFNKLCLAQAAFPAVPRYSMRSGVLV